MIRFCFALLFLGTASLAHAQFDVKQQLQKKVTQDKYVTFLTSKGYAPEVDEDGDIKFTYNERTFYITIDMEERNFFRIARLANLKLTDEAEITRAKEICHEVTKNIKIAKVYWLKGVVWTSSELLLANPDNYEAIFDRVLKLTESAYNRFVKQWKDS